MGFGHAEKEKAVHHREIKSSAVWVTRFAELQKQLEATAGKDHGICTFTVWSYVLEKFSFLRNIVFNIFL